LERNYFDASGIQVRWSEEICAKENIATLDWSRTFTK
jgi:hypothetical protein